MSAESTPTLNPLSLSGTQRRALRGMGHHLSPVVQVGRAGVTDGVVEATNAVLDQHELVKVSVSSDAPVHRKEAARDLARRSGSHLVQVLGRTALLYRRRFDEPEIELPGEFEEAPRPEETS